MKYSIYILFTLTQIHCCYTEAALLRRFFPLIADTATTLRTARGSEFSVQASAANMPTKIPQSGLPATKQLTSAALQERGTASRRLDSPAPNVLRSSRDTAFQSSGWHREISPATMFRNTLPNVTLADGQECQTHGVRNAAQILNVADVLVPNRLPLRSAASGERPEIAEHVEA